MSLPPYRTELVDFERRTVLGHDTSGHGGDRRGDIRRHSGGLRAESRVQARLFGRRRAIAVLHPSGGGRRCSEKISLTLPHCVEEMIKLQSSASLCKRNFYALNLGISADRVMDLFPCGGQTARLRHLRGARGRRRRFRSVLVRVGPRLSLSARSRRRLLLLLILDHRPVSVQSR